MAGSNCIKQCSACKARKPLKEFFADVRRSDGRRAKCKDCFPRTGGKPTPEQRAQGRRRRGETQAAYLSKQDRVALVAQRETASHCAHVKAWARWAQAEARKDLRASLHDAHVKDYRHPSVEFRRRYGGEPEFAIRQRLRTQLRKKAKTHPKLDDLMRSAIQRGGRSGTVEAVCGYDIGTLAAHLERLFTDGMNWPAFMNGLIHIDHIIPQASFDLSDIEDTRRCWALSNLQPLWAVDNLRKGARMPGQLQKVLRSTFK